MYDRNGWYYTKPRGHKPIALGTKNKKLAQKAEKKIHTDLEMGRYFPNTKSKYLTLGEITLRYNDEREGMVGPSSRASDRARRNCLLNFISLNTNLKDFTQNEVSKMMAWMHRRQYKTSVMNEQFSYITRVFNKAVYQWKIMSVDNHPTKGLKAPPAGKGRKRYLSEEESKRLWNVLDRPEWYWMRDVVTVGLQVGFRKSNLAMMQWGWVDLERKKIIIPKEYVLKTMPGNQAEPFTMPMSPDVYGVLGRLFQARNEYRGVMMTDNSGAGGGLSIGRIPISNNQRDKIDIKQDGSVFWGLKKKEDRYVFFIPTKNARNRAHTIWRMFCKDMKDRNQRSVISHAKIEDFVVHDMKHDFCTKLLLLDKPITSISKLAGHKDIRQTMTYAHVLDESTTDAVEAFKPRKILVPISSHQ